MIWLGKGKARMANVPGASREGRAECAGNAAARAFGLHGVSRAFSLVAFAIAIALALAVASPALPASAWADEPAEGDNAVDVTQLPDSSFIYDTSITDLSTADAYYDKQTVQVTGEVVGDRIDAGDGHHSWIQLASPSDASTVAVFMTDESAAKIDTYGAYGRKGTTLQVRGTFQLACATHDGVSDLHAQVVSVTEKGKAEPDEFDFEAFLPGLTAVFVGLAMMVIFYVLRERQR